MSLKIPPISWPALELAIDRHPLTVAPDTPLMDVLALMSQVRGSSCMLLSSNQPQEDSQIGEVQTCCALVMEGSQLVGMFTERELVQLTASGQNLGEAKVAEVMTRSLITLIQSNTQDVFTALSLLRQHKIRHLPVVDNQRQLVGIVTPDTIRQVLQPTNLLKVRSVDEVISPQVIHAPVTASVLSLAQLMAEHRISCVVITELIQNSKHKPLGIVTERDIVQFQSLELDLSQTQAQTAMSTPLFSLRPSDSLWMAHKEMQRRHVRRLVVSGIQGELLGIVTQTSLLRVLDPLEVYEALELLQRTVEQRTNQLRQANEQLQREVTERKHVEEALAESESKFLQNSSDIITGLENDGTIKYISPSIQHILGIYPEELQGKSFLDFVYSDDLPTAIA